MRKSLLLFPRNLLPAVVAWALLAVPVDATDLGTGAYSSPQEILDLLVLDADAFFPTGLRVRAPYTKMAELARSGADDEAVAAFGRYLVEKLRNPAAAGINPAGLDPTHSGIGGYAGFEIKWPPAVFQPASRREILEAADPLMQGRMGTGPGAVEIGEPGSVNWYLPHSSLKAIPTDKFPLPGLTTGLAFVPLARAFIETKDERYLDRWTAYMNDWVGRSRYLASLHPMEVPSVVHSAASGAGFSMIKLLSAVAGASRSNGESALNPLLAARIVSRIMGEETMPSMMYRRSNVHNWTPGYSDMLLAMLFDEYKTAPILFREMRRRGVEDHAVTQNLRDGSENQQDPWYNENYYTVANALTIMEARATLKPYFETPWIGALRSDYNWRAEIRDHLKARTDFLIRLRTPQNEWPIPFRGGDKRKANVGSVTAYPPAFDDAVNRSILDAVANGGATLPSHYRSDWFPYGGFNIVRSGWDKDSATGAMFTSPQPGAYGGYRSRSNNNVFGLSAYGEDLLVDDTTGHYMHPGSPIKVDGKNQFFHEKVYLVGSPQTHKSYQVSAWTRPAPWRWHESEHFNLMEGIYEGPFGDLKDLPMRAPRSHGPEEGAEVTGGKMVHGVRHQRVVLYDRASGIWIVRDTLASKDSHEYSQAWMLPITPGPAPAFNAEEIQIDSAQKMIRTDTDETDGKRRKVNLTMRQFSDTPLVYTRKSVPAEGKNGRVLMYGWERIEASWKGGNGGQVITAILARAPGQGDFQSVKESRGSDKALGFSATAANGESVQFLAQPVGVGSLSVGPVAATAEVLLLSGNRGIALGCTAFQLGGKAVADVPSDFEFTLQDGTVSSVVPIYRPIEPVEIAPGRNVFHDEVAVTLSSQTPGVEIRYTLDGTDPEPWSAMYEGPFVLKQSARVKARAYRPGVKVNPPDRSSTQASPVSLAVFDRKDLKAATHVQNAQPGLSAKYYEADWKALWLKWDKLSPKAKSIVPALWDLSLVPADNPALGSAPSPRKEYYSVVYEGYLKIPADGVYTLHAPREYVYPDVDAGYEIQVELGDSYYARGARQEKYGREEWYPSTRLHGFGTWSTPLKQGLHPFRVVFLDYRKNILKKVNRTGLPDFVWSGSTPEIKVSGPDMNPQPIPVDWFYHKD